MKIASRIYRMIGYDGAALLMLEFCMFAGVLYAVISPVVERRKKMLLGGELSVVFVGLNKFIHYICNVG